MSYSQEVSFSGNWLLAQSSLNNANEQGIGYSVNANYDLLPSNIYLAPSLSYASFGKLSPPSGPSRNTDGEVTAGIMAGYAFAPLSLTLSYELPFETDKKSGAFFESMLSLRARRPLSKQGPLGLLLSYDYYINKDTFYYTSQAGIGLYYTF